MAIAFVKSCSWTNSSGTWDLTPSWSGGAPANGTVLLAFIESLTQGTITVPSGWNFLDTHDSGSGLRSWVYWKVAASEPSGYTWTLGTAAKSWAWVGAYSGVVTTSDPAGTVATPNLGGTTHVCPSVAVPANGWLLNVGMFRRPSAGTRSYTINDGSAAERFDFATNAGSGNDIGGAVYDSNRALTAGNYSRTITGTGTEATEVLYSIALAPDAVAPISGGTGARWGVHL